MIIIPRKTICNEARELLGTAYYHCGRDLNGLDCAGVPIFIAIKLGVFVGEDRQNYDRIPNGGMLLKAMKDLCGKKIEKTQMKAGDILLMRFNEEPQHVGILVEDNYLIHSYLRERKVVLTRINETWYDRIIAVFEFPNVEKEEEKG